MTIIACFKAGLVAVPVMAPDPRKGGKELGHFINIQKDSGAKVVLTHNSYDYAKKMSDVQGMFSFTKKVFEWPDVQMIKVDALMKPNGSSYPKSLLERLVDPDTLSADAVAFLQYTSGSTSEPKGVIVSFGNISGNLDGFFDRFGNGADVLVSWLPQYHDFGLSK